MHAQTDRQTDRQKDRRMDGRTDGRMDRHKHGHVHTCVHNSLSNKREQVKYDNGKCCQFENECANLKKTKHLLPALRYKQLVNELHRSSK